MTDEKTVLDAYSTPGLKKNMLSYFAKKRQLLSLRYSKDAIDKTLADLYPEETAALNKETR